MNKIILSLLAVLLIQLSTSNVAFAGIPIQEKMEAKSTAVYSASSKVTKLKTTKKQNWFKKIVSKIAPASESKVLAIVLTIILPFLGIAIWQDAVTKDFWITLLLTLLLYLPGLIYAMSIILNDAR